MRRRKLPIQPIHVDQGTKRHQLHPVEPALTWVTRFRFGCFPVLIAITFHEAAHGYVARYLGDDAASKLGRVSLNPLQHIDPFGTILLSGLLLLARSPFLFGYAKPVSINFRASSESPIWNGVGCCCWSCNEYRSGNCCCIEFSPNYLSATHRRTMDCPEFKRNALIINVLLAVFNLFPLLRLMGTHCSWFAAQCLRETPCTA